MIKKKDLDQDNTKAWEEYIKNPSDIYDKDKNYSKINKDEKTEIQKDINLTESETNEDEEKTGWWS